MNYDEPEQPLQPIKKIDDEVLDRFINTYGFKREVQDTKKGEKQLNIASASIGDNIYIIRKDGKNKYYFLSVSKKNFDNFRQSEKEGFTFKFIDFNTDYFKQNEQKFIKSLKENKMFDDIEVKDGDYGDFEKKTIQTFTKYNTADRIKKINPKEIPDIQAEPVQEKKELMGDDDEEEEEEGMIDDEEEEERPIEQVQDMDKKKDDKEKPIKEEEEEDKIPLDDEKLNSQIVQYKQDFNLKPERTGNRGKMPKKYSDFFKEIKGRYGFTIPNNSNTGQAYLRVGNDIIFVRKLTDKTKGTNKYRYKGNDRNKDNNLMIAIMNKSDFPKLDSDNEDVKARFFNFSLD